MKAVCLNVIAVLEMKVCSQRMNFLNLLEKLDCSLCLTTHVLEAASRPCHDLFSVPYRIFFFNSILNPISD